MTDYGLKCIARAISMKAVFERLRWYVRFELKSKDPFKLNNDYTSHYARLVMKNESDLSDFFELRKLRARQGD